jgi:hypothetical protein
MFTDDDMEEGCVVVEIDGSDGNPLDILTEQPTDPIDDEVDEA